MMQKKININPQVSIWDNQWKRYLKKPFYKPNQKVINIICQIFENKLKNKKIIELGAGSGCDIAILTKKGAEGYALDFSTQSIKTIKYWSKKIGVKLNIKKSNINSVPFSDNYFDLVYSVGLMEHFKNFLPLIKEQIRITKPGGFLLIDVPQKYTFYTIAKHLRMKFNLHPLGWETEYSKTDFIRLAKKMGQNIWQIYGRESDIINRFPSFLKPFCNHFFSKYIEDSFLGPYISLCIGMILKVKK